MDTPLRHVTAHASKIYSLVGRVECFLLNVFKDWNPLETNELVTCAPDQQDQMVLLQVRDGVLIMTGQIMESG